MNVTNETSEDTPLLTRADLAVAAFALAETFNSYLSDYEEENFGELTKEQMEKSLNSLRLAFTKFDSFLQSTMEEQNDSEV